MSGIFFFFFYEGIDFFIKPVYNRSIAGIYRYSFLAITEANMLTACTENKDFLYRQTRDWLVRQMRTGKLKPGSRLPGERALADLLKISRGTARIALQELEHEGFIERVPSRGAFIKTKGETRQVRLALIFPEAGISTEYLYYSNWAIASEVQRGLLEGSMMNNSVMSFQYIPVDDAERNPEKYADKLAKEYDGVLFPSSQHGKLMEELKRRNYPFVSIAEDDSVPYITYNRHNICVEAVNYLLSCKAEKIIVLRQEGASDFDRKLQAIKEVYKNNNIKFTKENILEIPQDKIGDHVVERLKKVFDSKSKLPDVFFCTYPEAAFYVFRFAEEMGHKIPDDFMLMGYGNNVRLSPMVSRLTHVELPYYEMGQAGCKALIDKILYGKDIPSVQKLDAKLIIGKTTR